MPDNQTATDPTLVIPAGVVADLRAEIVRSGRARFTPALNPAAAEALREELTRTSQWSRSMRQGKAERELDPATLARLSPNQLAAVEAMALKGDETTFRFLLDVIRISPDPDVRQKRGMLIDQLAEGLNSAPTLSVISALAGETVTSWGGDATRYLPGHFLTTHNDGRKHGKRVLAMVLSLSDWHIDWGGLTLFHESGGDVAAAWVPRFNTITLFTVPQDHSVSWVTDLARWPRLAIAGWFYAD